MRISEKAHKVKKLRRQLYYLLEDEDADSPGVRVVEYGIAAIIIVNMIAIVLSTVPTLKAYNTVFETVERISVGLFGLEYILRIWAVGERIKHPVWGRVVFVLQPLMLIDLFAIAPSYLASTTSFQFARGFRLIRLLKLSRSSSALNLVLEVLRLKRKELLSTVLFLAILLVMASGLIFYAEHPVQPDVFSSIPESMWWAVMAMTTGGYGDIVPVSAVGKIIGGMVSISGVGFFAIPAGILASGFTELIKEKKSSKPDHSHREASTKK